MAVEVVSFRPTKEQAAGLERERRKLGFRTRSDVVRLAVQRLLQEEDDPEARVFKWKLPEEFQSKGRSITSEEIDEVVYGDHIWPGTDPR